MIFHKNTYKNKNWQKKAKNNEMFFFLDYTGNIFPKDMIKKWAKYKHIGNTRETVYFKRNRARPTCQLVMDNFML